MTHIIVALIVAAAVLLGIRRWARRALGNSIEPSREMPGGRWLLRPSNLLFAIGIAGVFYISLGNPRIDPEWFRGFAGIIILAFVLRHSENKAIG